MFTLSSRSKQFLHLLPRLLLGRAEPNRFLPRLEEPGPSSQQEKRPRGATSQTTGVTAAPHRVVKALGLGGRARGPAALSHRKQLQLRSSAPSLSQLWPLAKRQRERLFHGPRAAAAPVFQKTGKGGFGRSGVFRERRERDKNTSALPPSNQGLALISPHKVHTGIKPHARQPPPPREAHSTPVGVCRHALLLPINNSRWLCKPRGKVLGYRPATGLATIWRKDKLGVEPHCRQRKGVHLVSSPPLKYDYHTTRPLSHLVLFQNTSQGRRKGW